MDRPVFDVYKMRFGIDGKFKAWEYFAVLPEETQQSASRMLVPNPPKGVERSYLGAIPGKSIKNLAEGIYEVSQEVTALCSKGVSEVLDNYAIQTRLNYPYHKGILVFNGVLTQNAELSPDELGELVLEIERLRFQKAQ